MRDFHEAYYDERDGLKWWFRKKYLHQVPPRFVNENELKTGFATDVLSHVKNPKHQNETFDDFVKFINGFFESNEDESWYIARYYQRFHGEIDEILRLVTADRDQYEKLRNQAIKTQTEKCAFCEKKHFCNTKNDIDDIVTFFRAIDKYLSRSI